MFLLKDVEIVGLARSIKASGMAMMEGDKFPDQYPKSYKKLASYPPSTGHNNFLKGIDVYFKVKYPQYWTPQAQRYKFFEIICSSSKMHRLINSVNTGTMSFNEYTPEDSIEIVKREVTIYNSLVNEEDRKKQFQVVLSACPMGLELWMEVKTNYMQLKTIYLQRRNHKLKEWQIFCNWIETLPMADELIIST